MGRALLLVFFVALISPVFSQLPNGSTAPDFSVQDINGNTYSLYAMMGANKAACLDFSATWCSPCWAFHLSGALENVATNLSSQATVLFLEGDWSTNTACLYDLPSCVGGTQGDWVTGTPYQIADLSSTNGSSLMALYKVAYYPTLYIVSPDKRIWELEERTYQSYVNWITESFTLNATADITHSVCGDNGKIIMNPTGGYLPLSYKWNNGATSKDLVNIPGGTYSVTITDANGYFEKYGPYTINGPTKRVDIISSSTTNIKCNNEATGSIAVQVGYGIPPYSYNWSNGDKTNSITGLKAGSYTLTVTDNNNCTRVKTFGLTQPPDLTATATSGKDNCNKIDGFIQVKASGGVTPYSFNIGDGQQAGPYFPDLKGGRDYTVTITDANSCKETVSAYVDVTNKPKVDAGSNRDLDCIKEIINLDGSASDVGSSLSNLWTTITGNIVRGSESLLPEVDKPGKYYLKITDSSNKCFDIDSVIVNDARVFPNITATGDTTLNCQFTESELKGNSNHLPIKYYWKKMNDTIFYDTNKSIVIRDSGKYIFHVKDTVNLCLSKDTVAIQSDQLKPDAIASPKKNVSCKNAEIIIDGTASSQGSKYSYQWSTVNGNIVSGATTLLPLVNKGGEYNLEVTNHSNYCKSVAQVIVLQQTQPVASYTPHINGLEVQFTDLSQGLPTSWDWNFGDGTNSNQQNPKHSFNANGEYQVCLTINNDCGQDIRCQKIIVGKLSLTLTCPVNATEAGCQTQATIDAKFAAWLSTTSFTGGCNPALSNNNTGSPSACGGKTTVTFTVTSSCDPTETCTALFTVSNSPAIMMTCPSNTSEAACQTQAAINAKFATWLASATFTGGCNAAISNNNTGAPSACGGTAFVTFTVTSTCEPPKTCSATFGVAASTPVLLSCPGNQSESSCQTQIIIDGKYLNWLNLVSFSGGCNASLSNNSTGPPPACGGTHLISFTVTSTCEPSKTCSAMFSVAQPAPVVLTCPANQTEGLGQTQAQIDTKFSAWLSTANYTGGCDPAMNNDNSGAPPNTGGSTTVTFTVTSTCEATKTCSATFTVKDLTAVKNSTVVKRFELTPNPVRDHGFIEVQFDRQRSFELSMLNAYGQTIWSHSSDNSKELVSIDLSEYCKGLYFVVLTTDDTQQVLKWIVD